MTKLKWCLTKRMANYIERNKKLSPLNRLEYIFLRDLYRYLTKQILNQESKKRLYMYYIRLVDLCYFPNRPNFNKKIADVIYMQCLILLERDFNSEYTFILLNDFRHFQKIQKTLELLYNWAYSEDKGHFLSEREFWENMEFIRKEFNSEKIDLNYQVGKWPKKLRKRFWRKEKR